MSQSLTLTDSQQLHSFLFEESSDALLVFDAATLKFREANQAAEALTGLPRAELRAWPLDELFHGSEKLDELLLACADLTEFQAAGLQMIQPHVDPLAVEVTVRTIHIDQGVWGLLVVRPELDACGAAERRAVEALRESEHRYRSLVENADVCIHEIDLDGLITSMNPAGLRMVKLRREGDALGRPCHDFAQDDADKARLEQSMHRALDGQAVFFEFVAVVEAERRYFSSNFIPLFDGDGQVVKLMGVTRDITEQRESERSLRESEQRFRTIFEQAAVGVALIETRSGRFARVNRKCEQLVGYTSEELQELTFMEISSEGLQADLANMRKLRDGEITEFTMEKRLRRKDGTDLWINLTVSPTWNAGEKPRHHIAIVEDISERKRIAQALQRSEASLAKAQEIAHLGNWELDLTTGKLTGSAETYRMLGITAAESTDLDAVGAIANHIHHNDRALVLAAHQRALATGQPSTLDFRLVSRESGEVHYLRATGEMIRSRDGRLVGMFGTLQEITDQKKVELALRESEHKFRVISEQCPALVAIFQDGVMKYTNDMVSSITEYSKEELRRMAFTDVVVEEHRDLVTDRNRRRLRGEEVPTRYEFKLRKKSGPIVWIDFNASVIEYGGKPAVLATALDVTERRATEAQLRQSEIELAQVSRLTSMGEMVAGIAHEINQPLSAISGFADACATELGKSDKARIAKVKGWAESIGQQAVRCGDIIRRLRGYVQQKHVGESDVDINHVIQESLALLRNEIRHNAVEIECDLLPSAPLVRGNPVELQQVVVNLLTNATEVMQGCDPQQRKLTVRSSIVGDFLRVDIEDNGSGLDEEHLKRLFEAFFTTKENGLGMGLAISRSILDRHDGHLWAENRTPRGAVFHVELPLS